MSEDEDMLNAGARPQWTDGCYSGNSPMTFINR